MTITARELKLRLGRYLRAVQAGETVRVTMRGRLVAEMRPLREAGIARLDELVQVGIATPGTGRLRPASPRPARRSGSAVILEDRAAEAR